MEETRCPVCGASNCDCGESVEILKDCDGFYYCKCYRCGYEGKRKRIERDAASEFPSFVPKKKNGSWGADMLADIRKEAGKNHQAKNNDAELIKILDWVKEIENKLARFDDPINYTIEKEYNTLAAIRILKNIHKKYSEDRNMDKLVNVIIMLAYWMIDSNDTVAVQFSYKNNGAYCQEIKDIGWDGEGTVYISIGSIDTLIDGTAANTEKDSED